MRPGNKIIWEVTTVSLDWQNLTLVFKKKGIIEHPASMYEGVQTWHGQDFFINFK